MNMKLQRKIVITLLVLVLLFVAAVSVHFNYTSHDHRHHQCKVGVKVGVQDAEAAHICRVCGRACRQHNPTDKKRYCPVHGAQ